MDELDNTNDQVTFAVSSDDAGTATVKVSGELDISSTDALAKEVRAVLATHPSKLVVDVRGLRFADSSAIALWVQWATLVREFELCNPSPLLRKVIKAMGLSERLAVTPREGAVTL